MKRGFVLLLLALALVSTVSIYLFSSRQSPLSETELLQRAEDYALLVDSLKSVGYDENFSLKETNSFEDNLRRLWLREWAFTDARKNVELLLLLQNYDFIAEGIRSKASPDNPYYNDWPRDSQYATSSKTAEFSTEEVLWLMMLLHDADLPETHAGFMGVLAEAGANALSVGRNSIWFYFEKISPGLLERLYPSFWSGIQAPAGIMDAYRIASDDIQNRFMQAIDLEQVRSNTSRPKRMFVITEAEELMREYPPLYPWAGGYLRIKDASNKPYLYPYDYEKMSDVLVAVTSPANARFAFYEDYTQKEYYATYIMENREKPIDVYLIILNIRIVDLVTGEEIFCESVPSNPPPDEITIFSYYGIGFPASGKHDHYDFDYERFVRALETYITGQNQ